MNKPYDYLIVGAGLFGAVFTYEAMQRGKRCIVIEKRNHVGGNIYGELKDGINIHRYGAHIFHTNNKRIWEYVNRFVDFNNYINSPMANYKGEIYNLPFNMNTFYQMWGCITPQQARAKIAEQRYASVAEPKNLEEQAIHLVGCDIYEKLIKGYTEKQWGRSCKELPAFIIKRLPVRYVYDNNYFNDRYQGIPIGGYNQLIEKLLKGSALHLNQSFFELKHDYKKLASKVVYTGSIDAFFNFCLGELAYRGLRFETERLEQENYQGVAVINFTDRETPYTRSIEHKHFEFGDQPLTYITKEYPINWQRGDEAYYPINDEKNQAIYKEYLRLANQEKDVIFGGRLAEYKYYNMDQVIASALKAVESEFG